MNGFEPSALRSQQAGCGLRRISRRLRHGMMSIARHIERYLTWRPGSGEIDELTGARRIADKRGEVRSATATFPIRMCGRLLRQLGSSIREGQNGVAASPTESNRETADAPRGSSLPRGGSPTGRRSSPNRDSPSADSGRRGAGDAGKLVTEMPCVGGRPTPAGPPPQSPPPAAPGTNLSDHRRLSSVTSHRDGSLCQRGKARRSTRRFRIFFEWRKWPFPSSSSPSHVEKARRPFGDRPS